MVPNWSVFSEEPAPKWWYKCGFSHTNTQPYKHNTHASTQTHDHTHRSAQHAHNTHTHCTHTHTRHIQTHKNNQQIEHTHTHTRLQDQKTLGCTIAPRYILTSLCSCGHDIQLSEILFFRCHPLCAFTCQHAVFARTKSTAYNESAIHVSLQKTIPGKIKHGVVKTLVAKSLRRLFFFFLFESGLGEAFSFG